MYCVTILIVSIYLSAYATALTCVYSYLARVLIAIYPAEIHVYTDVYTALVIPCLVCRLQGVAKVFSYIDVVIAFVIVGLWFELHVRLAVGVRLCSIPKACVV